MKRVGGLFERLCSAENLTEAACRAAQGKRDRPAVRTFLAEPESHVAGLAAALRDETSTFDAYTSFEIRDPKTRTIRAPSFLDRVVHHGLLRAVRPDLASWDESRGGPPAGTDIQRVGGPAENAPAGVSLHPGEVR